MKLTAHMRAIVKKIPKNQADCKASMPNYQNVETIAAIPRVLSVSSEYHYERDFDFYSIVNCKFAFYGGRTL